MRRYLMAMTAVAALTGAAASPAAAFDPYSWNFCTANSLSVCMNFSLTQTATNTYELQVTYVSSAAAAGQTGVLTGAGIYHTSGSGFNVSNATIVATSPSNLSWALNSNGLNGGGSLTFDVAGSSNQGVNNGVPVGGFVRISFTSTNLHTMNLDNFYARAHVQSYGPNGCSLKPDSRLSGNVVDGAAAVDARCGVLPPPPAEVPEPMSMLLLATGLLGVGGACVRRRRNVVEGDEIA